MTDKLQLYFQYPFVRYALIVGILIALCSSLLGVTLVLKHIQVKKQIRKNVGLFLDI